MKSLLDLLFDSIPVVFQTPVDQWNSVDVDYEPPHVERLWKQIDGTDARLYLHRIHPCEEGQALFHPHPWPSAILLVSGDYEMGVGHGSGDVPPPVSTKLRLASGSWYEMDHVDGWHYVRPIPGCRPILSMMVTGKPWERWSPRATKKLEPLSQEKKVKLLQAMEFALSCIPKPIRG